MRTRRRSQPGRLREYGDYEDYGDYGSEEYGSYRTSRRSRRSRKTKTPAVAVVAGIVSVGLVAAAAMGSSHFFSARSAASAAGTPNMNCTLIVPANPLTAQGLATPYQLTATNPADGPCNEANPNQTAFVQGAVIDPATGQISVYDPLVVDAGTQPAAAPAVPTLPAGGIVALWFGFNGNTLSFEGADQAGSAMATSPATPAATATTPAATTPAATAVASVTATAGQAATGSGRHHHYQFGSGQDHHRFGHVQGTAAATTAAATPTAAVPTASALATATAAAAATTPAGSVTAPAVTGTAPPTTTDVPAASGTPDAILQQNNCIAGEDIAGAFSSFTQVGACNAVAFFQAANAAISAGKLTVPSPGTAKDGQPCLTTRNFGIIDQDQSDNVTTKYLATANGQIAQATAANQQGLNVAAVLVNGSDNGLIDLFVDPALGCTPWMVPDLASPGSQATALPLDELQSAAFDGNNVGGPEALVPLNDPMTLDNNGNFNTDKTNAYRSIVDQPALPAGETPAQYCGDMESIQGVRLQQDVNLLIGQTSPAPAMADNLFTFLAMRLQQSFTNLNCQNFGLRNDVSTTVNGAGVVIAACFLQQVNAVTPGAGNPTAGMTVCPATASATPTASSASVSASASPAASASTQAPAPTVTPGGTAGTAPGGNAGAADRRHHHWWF
jgi:hypothetical protein